MASILCRGFFQVVPNLNQTKIVSALGVNCRSIFLQSCLYRAKKSTRERKLKLCRKRKAANAAKALQHNPAIRYSRRKRKTKEGEVVIIDDSAREACPDNVWFMNMFKLREHTFAEAVNACRELHHPTIYNEPNAFLHAYIELDMSTDKKTKFFENFMDVVQVNYPFKHGEDRSILAFCKTKEQADEALVAGASLAGCSEIITGVKRGKITLPDFSFVVAHPDMLHELTVIRGLLRKKFPAVESGTLSRDLPALIEKFRVGIRFETKRDELNPRYGFADVILGRLDTEIEHLEDNLRLVLTHVRSRGPKRTKDVEDYKFLKRCFIRTDLNPERLLIRAEDYMEEQEIVDSDDEDDEAVAS